jgi:uncharacterized protein YbbK (DUF523 family)
VSGIPPPLTDASPGLRAARPPVPGTVPRVIPRPDERPALLVSACLLGTRCNHEAGHSRRPAVEALAATYRLVPICPEVCGGLATPRAAAERLGDRVMNTAGDDVTDAYERGASAAVELAIAVGAERAVLKARSPSCGSEQIYDGTFSRSLRSGVGVTAEALRAAGIEIVSEENLPS